MADESLLHRIEELEKEKAALAEKFDEYRELHGDQKESRKDNKDRLFKFIFGNPDNKAWTLSLYNAINGTDYTNPDDIQFNTIGDAVYMGMRNDVSFIVAFEMDLWEHQSTFNPNMPMRFFIYAGRLYEKYIQGSDYYQYSSSLQQVPRPVCMCFYNGKKEQPERQVLKLSDAYGGDGDIEVKVTMLNINYGMNQQVMDACEPLKEYAWIVDAVRKHQAEKLALDAAVDAALDEMPDAFVLKAFLLEHRAEVKNMFLTEYNEEKVMEKERQEGKAEGIIEVLVGLVKDGILSIKDAAKRAGITETAFEQKMTAK